MALMFSPLLFSNRFIFSLRHRVSIKENIEKAVIPSTVEEKLLNMVWLAFLGKAMSAVKAKTSYKDDSTGSYMHIIDATLDKGCEILRSLEKTEVGALSEGVKRELRLVLLSLLRSYFSISRA